MKNEKPQAEFVNTESEFKWRIVLGEETSEWSSHYQGILAHTFSDGRTFMLLADYWNGGPISTEVPVEVKW